MQTEYIIRPVKQSDSESIKLIIQNVMTEYGATGTGYSIVDNEVENIYEAYSGAKAAYFIIENNGRILGGAGVAHLEGGDEDTCELKKMYFLPEARGKGLGSKLLKLCLAEAKILGYKQCYLETLGRMPEARALYEKHGFEQLKKPMGNTGHFKCEAWYLKTL